MRNLLIAAVAVLVLITVVQAQTTPIASTQTASSAAGSDTRCIGDAEGLATHMINLGSVQAGEADERQGMTPGEIPDQVWTIARSIAQQRIDAGERGAYTPAEVAQITSMCQS
jgi:hypothetical protein